MYKRKLYWHMSHPPQFIFLLCSVYLPIYGSSLNIQIFWDTQKTKERQVFWKKTSTFNFWKWLVLCPSFVYFFFFFCVIFFGKSLLPMSARTMLLKRNSKGKNSEKIKLIFKDSYKKNKSYFFRGNEGLKQNFKKRKKKKERCYNREMAPWWVGGATHRPRLYCDGPYPKSRRHVIRIANHSVVSTGSHNAPLSLGD